MISRCALPIASLAFILSAVHPAWGITPDGLVFESEAVAQPDTAWAANKRTDDRWMLWTSEDAIEKKRSGGAVLASPTVSEDRAAPEDGAPPLHCVVDDLKPGMYRVYVSAPGRPLAYSLDGEKWFKHQGSELVLGAHHLPEGRFEVWVDDRYAHPYGNPGPGYFDYIRFVPVPDAAQFVERHAPWPALESRAGESDTAVTIPLSAMTDLKGFQIDGTLLKGGAHAGDSFSWTADRDGVFYPAVLMVDDEDGVEQLSIRHNDEVVACAVGDQAASRAVFSVTRPLTLAKGDRITFTADTGVGLYRILRVLIAEEPVVPPPPSFEYIEPWCPEPGAIDLCWTTSVVAETGVVEYETGGKTLRTEHNAYEGRNHRVRLRGLEPGAAYAARILTSHEQEALSSETICFTATPPRPAPTTPFRVPLAVVEPTDAARQSWPATVGMPFSKGALARLDDLRLSAENGEAIPLQAELFSRWPDGSVKWAILSFPADTDGGAPGRYVLEARPEWERPAPSQGNVLTVTETADAWRLTTDTLTFTIGKQSPGLFDHVGFDRDGDGHVAPGECIQTPPMGGNMRLVTDDGQSLGCGPPDAGSFEIEVNGPVRAILTWGGPLAGPDGARGWRYRMRIAVWRGVPALSVHVSVSNEASESKYQAVKSLALRVPLDGGDVLGAFADGQLEAVPDADGLWLHQDKDNRFAVRTGSGVAEGERAEGYATADDGRTRITVSFPDFWQTYPSGFAIKPDGVHVRLLPQLAPDTYDGEEAWFYKLHAWFRDGDYLFRAGQLTRHHVLVHYAPTGEDASHVAPWLANPLLPQAPPEYLCATGALGRPVFPRTPGQWDDYEAFFDAGFARNMEDQQARRSFGWMHYGDWYGERYCNYGNNEYDLAWALAMQWMRTGDRRLFDRGQAMARHYSTVDTLYGPFTASMRGIVWEHSFNHLGTALSSEELRVPEGDADMQKYLESFGRMITGAMDPQGHIFQEGNWMYAALTGDPWYRDAAERICSHQAEKLTPAFNFGIERSGGWPITNACAAYNFSGNPYYLNAARIMVERCLQREDPVTGGWPHTPPIGETAGVRVLGGKAFAVGILSNGLLRYLDQETIDRPEVRRMLVRGADWLMNESWIPGKGFRYITNAPNYRDSGGRGMTCLLNADIVAFAYEQTGDEKYLEFWNEMMLDAFENPPSGMGKSFTQAIRQTVYGLDRVRQWGIVEAPSAEGE